MLPAANAAPRRALLFAGHRVDAPGRPRPRFPPEAEAQAREMIRDAVEAEAAGEPALGIAGGASGGDILFHEVCLELEIPSELFLAMPREAYVAASVADGGPGWVVRFDRLLARLPARQLSEAGDLPALPGDGAGQGDLSIWQRTNLWMLAAAFEAAAAAAQVRLIALWNGEAGDGSGGTRHMVEIARRQGARAHVLDAAELLAAAGS